MGRPDLRTRAPDFANFSRAQSTAFIAAQTAALAKQKPLTKRRVRAGRSRSRGVFFRQESRRSFQQRQGIRNAQRNTVQRRISQARQRLKTLDRKEKITSAVLEKGRTETFLSPESRTRIGARAAALARARKRGQLRTVTRTAARRGRQVTTTVLTKKTRTIAGRSCNVRLGQDVSKLTTSEAVCELDSKRLDKRRPTTIGGRRIKARKGGIKLNEREARLVLRARSRSGQVRGFSSALVSQASSGLRILDFLKAPSSFDTEVKRVGGRSSGSIVTIRRLKPNIRKHVNVIRSRGAFILSGGTSREFDAILSGDIANRQSARGRVSSVSRGRVRLNQSSVDPFFGGRNPFARRRVPSRRRRGRR